MAVLLHLNGPSGVGKSTLAHRYAAQRPGTLALDIDRVVTMIGGWEQDFWGTLRPARTLALAMAERHLATGHDVVLPQLVTSHDEVARFEQAAARGGATYVEVALLVAEAEQVRRFRARPRSTALEAAVAAAVEAAGGDTLLGRIQRDLGTYLAGRPSVRRLQTDGVGPEEVLGALTRLLAAPPGPPG